ncbi:response regulator [Cohnella suwonensis]|uniref:Response regulator n=1 Tax=Cohnella suwonensis TaxID=696072 RepID=A0ABW0LY77_9BACL
MYKVLLVDDEPLAIEGLRLFVDWEAHGFRVCGTCENGEDALALIDSIEPDVVVTDIRMPGMNGLDLIGHVQGASRKLPEFVILSAYGEFAYAKRALRFGVTHYLLKPVVGEEAAEMLLKVRHRLEERKSESAAKAISFVPGDSRMPLDTIRSVQPILEEIERLDADRTAAGIRKLFEDTEARSPEWIGMLASYLDYQCSRLIQELGGSPSGVLRRQAMERALRLGTADGVAAFAGFAIEELRLLQAGKPAGTMADIDRYILEHYRTALSIKEVASRFFLNPVYLGKAYQDKFGHGLLERIHDLRIQDAKRLLRQTDRKTSAIAEEVGYGQYNYFLRQFEKRVGMKPAAYRYSAKGASL